MSLILPYFLAILDDELEAKKIATVASRACDATCDCCLTLALGIFVLCARA